MGRRVMLSQEQIAAVKAEIEKLRGNLNNCTDIGLRKFIKSLIEQEEQKLESERAPNSNHR